jgi:ankyrin repeat protein
MFLRTATLLVAVSIVAVAAHAGGIHDAARNGHLDDVKTLLAGDPALVNAADGDSRTPLHWACRGDHPDLVAFLIAGGADVNALDRNQIAPLHSAASRGYTHIARLLIDNGAGVDPPDYEKQTPLHYATMNAHPETAGLLLKSGADTEARNARLRTPLLLNARQNGDVETGRVLLDHGADINAVDKYGSTPLELSAWRGYREYVVLLIDRGVSIPEDAGKQAYLLQRSVSKGLPELFEIFVQRNTDLTVRNESGGSLLHSAATGGDPDIIQRLVDAGLPVNESDNYGWFPLHYAGEEGHAGAASALLDHGADINERNLCGETAYHRAVAGNHDSTAGVLARRGADTGDPRFPRLEGPYMGQAPPGDTPELFARGIVSSIRSLHTPIVFSSEGYDAYWPVSVPIPGTGYTRGVIFYSRVENGAWTKPEPVAFNTSDDHTGDPCLSPDGNRLFFLSSRPLEPGGSSRGENIWYVDRTGSGWSEPKPVGDAINSVDLHWQVSVAGNGNLYFGSSEGGGYGQNDVYVSRLVDGEYQAPENLGTVVNTETPEFSPFVAPDESYLLFTRVTESGKTRLYFSRRTPDGGWSKAKDMGPSVNSGSGELCPVVSSDGRYLFFLSRRNDVAGVYWMSTAVIDSLLKD